MKEYTKSELIDALKQIKRKGWIQNQRPGNAGGVGNTLEDLLGIQENNLPIPNASEWELKAQRSNTTSLITLFHIEPSPRTMNLVPKLLLLKYGWAHQYAGTKYSFDELSFRQTIGGNGYSDRGFKVVIDRKDRKVLISFNSKMVSEHHQVWLQSVEKRTNLNELDPQPYWGFDDLFHKAGTKLLNCFYVVANSKKVEGVEYFHYTKIEMLEKFSIDRFLLALENNNIMVDFDARTGHNHGTKFRMKQNILDQLYEKKTIIAE
jgi:hypothetical protein